MHVHAAAPNNGVQYAHTSTICLGNRPPEPDCILRIHVVKCIIDRLFLWETLLEAEVAGIKGSGFKRPG